MLGAGDIKSHQNNTGMYTKGSSQQTCKIWKGLPKPQQWNTTDKKREQDRPQFMIVKFQNMRDLEFTI